MNGLGAMRAAPLSVLQTRSQTHVMTYFPPAPSRRPLVFGLLLVVGLLLGTVGGALPARAQTDAIQPSPEHSRYWQYDGELILPIGGSKDDNLFQIPNLKAHLDEMEAVGANYIRNTMSARDDEDGNVRPFARTENGQYDLTTLNSEYWERFENMLQWTAERDIVVQIELWDQWDYNTGDWGVAVWNPDNNVNYSVAEVSLKGSGHYQDVTASSDATHDFFMTVPAIHDDETVLRHQKRFVDEVLKRAFQYDHVLYTVTNELFVQHPPAWGGYWARYVKEQAEDAGVEVYVTEMFQSEEIRGEQHRHSLDQQGLYDYVDLSQNSTHEGQDHWDNLQWVRSYVEDAIRPINHVKTYGGETDWTDGPEPGIDRWWRNILGGAATTRFHRPPAGIGLNDRAKAQIESARMLLDEINVFEAIPDAESRLLGDRAPNVAYLAHEGKEVYALYFPDGGAVTLDLGAAEGSYTVEWLDVEASAWTRERTVDGGQPVRLEAPGEGNWAAVVEREQYSNSTGKAHRLRLDDLPPTHRAGPSLLNVRRILDLPQTVGLAALQGEEVRLRGGEDAVWSWARRGAETLWTTGSVEI